MKVAVVHPHFRRGGVTRVVENAVRALAGCGVDAVALSGEAYAGDQLPRHRVIEGLGYDPRPFPNRGGELAAALRAATEEVFGGPPDLWHFHNHGLGKNLHLPAAIRELARAGDRILLQIHEFAEDGRPENYALLRLAYPEPADFAAALYPAAPQIHYALLNGRDAAILRGAGIAPERCHLLPNPVAVPALRAADETPLPEGERLILYPTRAIRRKNVGEVLFHAALAPVGTVFGTTLRPDNPAWQPIHRAWEAFAKELRLPVHFGLGESSSFDGLMQRADALITTSVAEGFGLAFLEPALFGKPLVGRDLPAITADFRRWGIALDNLYTRLPVPAAYVDKEAVRTRVEQALGRLARSYRRQFAADATDRALGALQAGDGTWDFGRLDESLQRSVVRAARNAPDAFAAAAGLLASVPGPETVAAQRAAVEKHLSLPAHGNQLAAIYRRLGESRLAEPAALDAPSILEAFLDPSALNLLRS